MSRRAEKKAAKAAAKAAKAAVKAEYAAQRAARKSGKTVYNTVYEVQNANINPTNPMPKKKKKTGKIILSGFFALAGLANLTNLAGVLYLLAALLMAPIDALQEKLSLYLKKPWKTILIIVLIFAGALSIPTDGTSTDGLTDSDSQTKTEITADTDIVVDDETIYDFYTVTDAAGISRSDAKRVEKIEDWSNGPRYSFTAEGMTVRVYCLMDGTIKTVKVGTIDLYKKGAGAWKIDNFVVSDAMREQLIYSTEEAVKGCLNYPSTADFPLLDWSIGRDFNVYGVSSHVTAKNAFGVEEDLPFNAKYVVDGDNVKLVELVVDGSVAIEADYEKATTKRKKVDVKTISSNDEGKGIRIVYSELGEYGEKVNLDSSEYIWYKVPAGSYEMTCNTKQCTVFIDKNETSTNSEGYTEVETVTAYNMAYGDKETIKIKNDEHIFITINGDVTLVPKK